MVMAGDRPPVDRALTRDLGDEIDLGELLAVRALRADGDSPAVRWHGNWTTTIDHIAEAHGADSHGPAHAR